MAKFYTTVTNSRGVEKGISGGATRQGAHIRTWDAGIDVRAFIDTNGNECFSVCASKGSNGGPGYAARLGVLENTPDGLRWRPDPGCKDAVKRL